MTASLATTDASAHIDWLCEALGFEVQLKVTGEGGAVAYSELVLGDAMVSVADARGDRAHRKAPREVGGVNTAQLCVFVDDVDAHCARARAAGGVIVGEPKTSDYGDDYWSDRSYEVQDPEGHRWYFVQRLREKP